MSILILGPDARSSVDGGPLKVSHLKCGVQSPQKEHLSICKQTHTSRGDDSSSESSLQGRPAQPTCPGFSLEEIFGRSYKNLLSDEREQVACAAVSVGLRVLEEKSSVISVVCLKESPSHQRPCRNCAKILELSGFKDTLDPRNPKSKKERFSQFRALEIGAGKGQKATNVNQSRGLLYRASADNTPLGESLVPTHYHQPTRGA